MTSFDRGRRRELQISFSLFAVVLSLSPTFAKAQQICQGNNKGSTDPNAVLYWTLTTHMNTPCISENVPPTNWINTGRHVVESAKHGRVGFASDPTHILYVPKTGFIGTDSFTLQFDRRIFTTGERVHRVVSYTMNVVP